VWLALVAIFRLRGHGVASAPAGNPTDAVRALAVMA